jgi:hypothetical protein
MSAEIASSQGEANMSPFAVVKEETLQAVCASGYMASPIVVIDQDDAASRRPTNDDVPGSGMIVHSAGVLPRNQSTHDIGHGGA